MIFLVFGYILFCKKVALHCLFNYFIISLITGTIFAYGVTSSGKTHTMHVRSIIMAILSFYTVYLINVHWLSILFSLYLHIEALFHAWFGIMLYYWVY